MAGSSTSEVQIVQTFHHSPEPNCKLKQGVLEESAWRRVAEEVRKTDFEMMSRNIPQPRVQQCILDQYVDEMSRVMLFTSSEWRQICVLADRFVDFASRAIYLVDEVTAEVRTTPSVAQRTLTQDDDAEGLAPPSTPPWPACVDGLW